MNPQANSPMHDEHASQELRLFIDNDGDLYRQQRVPIEDNLLRKKIKGTFDAAKSVKLWGYLVEAGAKKYVKEFGGGKWNVLFSPATRRHVAEELARDFEWSYGAGDFREREAKLRPKGRVTKTSMRAALERAQARKEAKAEVEAMFKKHVMPTILESEKRYGGGIDGPLRREAWNNWIDGLQRDGTITEVQAHTWGHPKWLETWKGKR